MDYKCVDNPMFISQQYVGKVLSSDFVMMYFAITPDYQCMFTYMCL